MAPRPLLLALSLAGVAGRAAPLRHQPAKLPLDHTPQDGLVEGATVVDNFLDAAEIAHAMGQMRPSLWDDASPFGLRAVSRTPEQYFVFRGVVLCFSPARVEERRLS